jgi:ethanolamine permease
MATEASRRKGRSVQYEREGEEYLKKRELKRGAAGWVLLAGLGVAYVISGDFAGWNFGLEQGGWGGLLIAGLIMAVMYSAMIFSLAEMATAIPVAGGGYGFARRAMGPWGGFLTGTAILIEYAIAPAAIATFIGAYVDALIGVGGPIVYLVFYLVFIGIHLVGVGEALKVIFAITALAAIALLVFVIGMIPKFDPSNLTNIAPDGSVGSSDFLPFGLVGIWAAIPYAIWFFLAVEGVPLAAEETRDPRKDMPKGMIASIFTLVVTGALVLTFGPGGAGAEVLSDSGDPLTTALSTAYNGENAIYHFVNVVGLAGLIASFFSIIFAYSRQIFALSRAGYLPKVLSVTTKRKVPALALIVPGAIGFCLSLTGEGDLLILVAVFGATLSYVLMMLSHILLRTREPDLERPYRTPGGRITSGVALVLAMAALVAGFLVDTRVVVGAAIVYGILVAYFALYSRHHLVASAPEEEFEAVQAAEQEID